MHLQGAAPGLTPSVSASLRLQPGGFHASAPTPDATNSTIAKARRRLVDQDQRRAEVPASRFGLDERLEVAAP